MFIVTGGAGFIGSALVWHLNKLGIDDVLVVDQLASPEESRNLDGLLWRDYLTNANFLTKLEAGQLRRRIRGIFHLGACSSTMERDLGFLYENNFRTTQRLAQWSLRNGVRFVYASSASTYGDGSCGYDDKDSTSLRLKPMNPYGWSKQWMDLWAIKTGAANRIVGLKFFNVFGPNEYHKGVMSSVIFKAYHQIQETGRLKLFKSYRPDYGDGQQCRDFVYVKDCCKVMWWLWQNPHVGGIYNLGTGQARTWNDLGRAVFAALGKPEQIDYIDMPEALRSHYQYYTRARMNKLVAAGYREPFLSLEDATADYVQQHLSSERPYLHLGGGEVRRAA